MLNSPLQQTHPFHYHLQRYHRYPHDYQLVNSPTYQTLVLNYQHPYLVSFGITDIFCVLSPFEQNKQTTQTNQRTFFSSTTTFNGAGSLRSTPFPHMQLNYGLPSKIIILDSVHFAKMSISPLFEKKTHFYHYNN